MGPLSKARGRRIALNQYETAFIIEPNAESQDIERIIEEVQNLISGSGGEVTNVNNWGKKRLAYEVKGNKDGNYVFIDFAADPQFIQRLERYFGLTEQIIKYMTVRAEKLPGTKTEVAEEEDEEFSYEGLKAGTEDDDEDEE
jgi:small subunit ribosomal protein S6